MRSDRCEPAFWDAFLERYLAPARERLGAHAEAMWTHGREVVFEDAVELALRE